jgi:hypothetical protein
VASNAIGFRKLFQQRNNFHVRLLCDCGALPLTTPALR